MAVLVRRSLQEVLAGREEQKMHGSGAHLVGSSPAHTGCLQGATAVKSSSPHHNGGMGLARIDKTFREGEQMTNSTGRSAKKAHLSC